MYLHWKEILPGQKVPANSTSTSGGRIKGYLHGFFWYGLRKGREARVHIADRVVGAVPRRGHQVRSTTMQFSHGVLHCI